MIRRPPRSTPLYSSAASDVYKRQVNVTAAVSAIGLGICGFLLVVHWNQASILHIYGDVGPQRYWGHDFDLLGSPDVIDHVTIRLGVGTFLLVVNDDHASILHRYGDTELQRFWGHEFDFLGSRDVIGHVTIGFGTCGFLLVVHWNQAFILHRYGDIAPQI